MTAARWLAALAATATIGWCVSRQVGFGNLTYSPTYQVFVVSLLAIGLYGSTANISLRLARQDLRTIAFATTVGVFVKAALITGGMYLVDPKFAALGLTVAQIDPLSVAAMLGRSGMSDRAKTILQAWSSFDDPVTTLLAIYAVAWLVAERGAAGPGNGGMLAYAGGLWLNAALAAGAYLIWRLAGFARARARRRLATPGSAGAGSTRKSTVVEALWQALLVALLVGLAVVAVRHVLMLGLAVTGLFFRPKVDRLLRRLLHAALLTATFALGLLLTDGIQLWKGFALASLAWLAQLVVVWILPTRLTKGDRRYLALGQQNGITSIVLALAIEPALPGTIGIVAPAVLVINLIHLIANTFLVGTPTVGRAQSASAVDLPGE